MNTPTQLLLRLICAAWLMFLNGPIYAACVKTPSVMSITLNNSAPLNFGKVHYSSNYIQPLGSILRQIIVPPSHRGLHPDTVLWTCDKADLPNIYFLVATAGWDTFGGHEEIGDGIYATWFRYIGLKQKMGGVTLGRNWQKLNITSYKLDKNKIKIRLRDIPPLEATLIKINSLPRFNPPRTGCNRAMAIAGTYKRAQIFQGGTGSCDTASAFIQLSGNSKVKIPFGHDDIGQDSNNYSSFYRANNGLIYGLNNSNTTVTQDDTCAVRTRNPVIQIPPISFMELKQNKTIATTFNIELECNANLKSGVNTTQLAMGFLPSNQSQQIAKRFNLLNNKGASRYLIPENYQHANTAKGIGISIQNPKNQQTIQFLSPSAPSGGGNAAGWYPIVENNTTNLASRSSGYHFYSKEYRAVLQKLPNQTPTAGQFKTTATLMIKIQ